MSNYSAKRRERPIGRIIIAICAGLVALSAISVQAAPLPPEKAGPTKLAVSPPVELAADGADMDLDAPAGKISGAAGIGAVAFRRRGEVYLAANFRIKEGLDSDWGMRLLLSRCTSGEFLSIESDTPHAHW